MNRYIIAITLALAATTANAQSFLDNLRSREDGKGTVNVIQDAAIDSLVNGTIHINPDPKPVPQTTTPEPDNKKQTPADATPEHRNETPKHETTTTTPVSIDLEESSTVVDTRKKVMRNSYKTQGYRIQVFSGGNSRKDRQKAETAGTVMKSNFPSEPIYVHFYSPSWKCRMGNYKTIEEARRYLAQIKKLGYPQACIVKGTISVQY